MSASEIITRIIEHIVAAFLIGASLYLFQRIRYGIFLYSKFNDTEFDVYFKGFEKTIISTVICKVKGNKIIYNGTQATSGRYGGEFIINPFNLKIGEGYHLHKTFDGFNFPKMVIKDENTFFVETSYISAEKDATTNKIVFKINYQAFIWKRATPKKKWWKFGFVS